MTKNEKTIVRLHYGHRPCRYDSIHIQTMQQAYHATHTTGTTLNPPKAKGAVSQENKSYNLIL